MPLFFSQLCSWTLLLLLVSNLLLWEDVASVPLSSKEIDDDQLVRKKLFDHAMILSQNISNLNMELRRVYTQTQSEFSEKFFHKFLSSSAPSYNKFMLEFYEDQEFLIRTLTCCHNYSMKTPKNMDQVQKIPVEAFPKLILSRMRAWNDTHHNLLTILRNMPGTHDEVLSIAKGIETNIAELYEDIKSIISMIYGTTENVEYTVFSGLEDLQSPDEEFRVFAICKFSYCLHKDIHMVDLCLKLLSCVGLTNSDICSSPRIEDDS